MTDTVWVTGRGRGGSTRKHFHTDEDCRLLGQARQPFAKDRATLPDRLEECPACAGTIDHDGTEQPFELRDKLLAADADSVGGDA